MRLRVALSGRQMYQTRIDVFIICHADAEIQGLVVTCISILVILTHCRPILCLRAQYSELPQPDSLENVEDFARVSVAQTAHSDLEHMESERNAGRCGLHLVGSSLRPLGRFSRRAER